MKLVILESPFKGNAIRNAEYARACMRDCLMRGEAPYASHLLFTQAGILDDDIPEERRLGIEAGLQWGSKADATIVYTDLGITEGMTIGIQRAVHGGRPVIYRKLESWGERNAGV